MVMCLVIR